MNQRLGAWMPVSPDVELAFPRPERMNLQKVLHMGSSSPNHPSLNVAHKVDHIHFQAQGAVLPLGKAML